MVEAVLTSSLHNVSLILDYDLAMLTCVCVRPLLKVVARSLALGMKILRSIYGWTRVIISAHVAILS
jgi:hypothetical protein